MQHFDASDYKDGLQGRQGFSSLFLGSVSEAVQTMPRTLQVSSMSPIH